MLALGKTFLFAYRLHQDCLFLSRTHLFLCFSGLRKIQAADEIGFVGYDANPVIRAPPLGGMLAVDFSDATLKDGSEPDHPILGLENKLSAYAKCRPYRAFRQGMLPW